MHMKSCCKELKEQWLDTKLLFLDPYKMRAAFLSLMDPEDLSCQMLVAAEVKENIWKEPAGRVTRGPAAANHTPSLVCRDWGSLCSLVWESRGCSSVLPAALGLGCCWQFVPWGESAAQGTINSSFLSHPLPSLPSSIAGFGKRVGSW